MKIVSLIARLLLGLVFLVFGADKIVVFIPSGPLPTGTAGQFMAALVSTKYLMFVGLCEAVSGLLLLLNRFVPLALTILGPVIVNILLTGILMAHQGLPAGIVFAGTPYDVFDQLRAFYDHVGGSGRLLMMGQGDLLDHDETVANLTLLSKECRREFAIREGRNNRENSAKRLPNRDLENAQMRRRY